MNKKLTYEIAHEKLIAKINNEEYEKIPLKVFQEIYFCGMAHGIEK